MRLKDKIAVVTGASSGMGHAIAELFAKEGATVIAVARRKERLEELAKSADGLAGKIVPFTADVSDAGGIDGIFDLALEKFGRVDILVNNAGIVDNAMPINELTDELWERIIAVNLTAPMKLTRRAVQEMLKQGSGNIINVSSVGGLHGCRGGTSYVTSKHGLLGMTKSVGYMYAQSGIRCNAICPGGVDTEIGEVGLSNPSQFGIQKLMSGIGSNPRNGSADEIATIALFLASDDSSFINGTTIVADAGWTAY